jgi:hypothetical protein
MCVSEACQPWLARDDWVCIDDQVNSFSAQPSQGSKQPGGPDGLDSSFIMVTSVIHYHGDNQLLG